MFADDVKMINSSKYYNVTQKDLDELNLWQKKWLLSFNTKDNKCKVLHVGKDNPKHQYYLDGQLLLVTEE